MGTNYEAIGMMSSHCIYLGSVSLIDQLYHTLYVHIALFPVSAAKNVQIKAGSACMETGMDANMYMPNYDS